MNKIEELLEQVKGKDLKDLKELLNKKQVVVEKEKKCSIRNVCCYADVSCDYNGR